MSDTPRDPDQDDDATTRLPRPGRGDSLGSRPTGSTPDTSGAGSGYGDTTAGGAAAGVAGSGGSGYGGTAAGGTGSRASDFGSSSSGGSASGDAGSGARDADVGSGTGGAGSGGAAAGSSAARAGSASRGRRTGASRGSAAGKSGSGWRRILSVGDSPETPDEQQRRRRRWWVAGISIGAALVVIALCAGVLSVVSAVDNVRDRASEVRETRELRDLNCIELERRLNRLTPPGATAGPAGRAVAIRDENSAVRIYLGEISDERAQDGWRQLLDARAVFADALDRQSKSRTPAFFVAPRSEDDESLADDLEDWSPAPCAGPIRRLAAPDL